MPANLENVSFIPIPKKGNAKECSNYFPIALISHTSKLMLNILQASVQQYVNQELPNVQDGFRKRERNQRSTCQPPLDHRKGKKILEKPTSASLTMLKPLAVWITTNFRKFLKTWKCQTTLPATWEMCMQVKKHQLEADIGQQTGPNWERSMSRLFIITLLI